MQTETDVTVSNGRSRRVVPESVPGVTVGLISDRRVVPFYERTLPKLDCHSRDPTSYALHLGFWDARTRHRREAIENEDRTLARLAAIEPGDRVLDAGCGFGTSSIWLAEELGTEVVGVDLSPSQVVEARRLAACASSGVSERVEFRRADFCGTGFSSGTFDVVWAVESVCHAADKESFLAEAYRLLRPGGRLVVADFFRSARLLDSAEEALVGRWLAGWAIPDLLTGDEFVAVARRAGFSAQTFADATAEVFPSLRLLHRRALLACPAVRLLHMAGILSQERLAAILSGLLQFETLGRGLWSYGLFAATKDAKATEIQENRGPEGEGA